MLPNFIIIGAAKAGTSSLYYYLKQHPDVYMSEVKETNYFALKDQKLNFQNPDKVINTSSITTEEAYRKLFEDVKDEVAVGEASPLYLYSPKAAEQIKLFNPSIKLIVILRNPVYRAYSCYNHLVRDGYETLSFSEALKEENNRIRNNWAHLWHYKHGGYYYRQLKPYFDRFNPEQIRIYFYEDFNNNSITLTQDIYRFIGVDASFIPDLTRMNVSGVPKLKILHSLFSKANVLRSTLKPFFPRTFREKIGQSIREWNRRPNSLILPNDKNILVQEYREDIHKLEKFLQKDLSSWLK